MKKFFLASFFLLILVCAWFFWHASTPTLETKLSPTEKASEEVKTSLSFLPTLPLKEEDKHYTIEDTRKDGIQITYANQGDNTALAATPNQEKPSLTLHFPKEYATDPIEVEVADGKSILIQDKSAKGDYTSQSLSFGSKASKSGIGEVKSPNNPISWLQSIFGSKASKPGEEKTYLSYTDPSKRITTYYAYGHDQATGEKQLKNWQVYDHPAIVKGEQVAYSFTNAKLKKNDSGTISVYYYGDQDLQNDKASAEVDPSLMARAQRTLAKEIGDSIDSGETPANFVIPKPYYINSGGDQIDLDWRLSMDGKDLSIDFTPDTAEYPLALDPTLSFTAPAMSNTGDVITGESGSFGTVLTTGDFNSDGKIDLVVSAYAYSTSTGRVYIFYSDGGFPDTASNADVIITGGAVNNRFGFALASGDLNSDGRTDLIVGTQSSLAFTDKAYIFYNDGSYPKTAPTADVIITGISGSDFGRTLATGDFNADGRTDLAVTAGFDANPNVYIFYNDGSIPTTSATADVTITGVAGTNSFGSSLAAGDFNSDGTTDLAVGASGYATETGNVWILYNDGSYPAAVTSADVIITGAANYNHFGVALVSGDFNADGRTDLAVGAEYYSTYTGRVYIFYNDGSIPTTAGTADVTITGEGTNNSFGYRLKSGDFNTDGRMDFAVGAAGYSSSTGRVYIFYNDGSIPTTAGTADVIITGEASSQLGYSLTSGDFNADGKTDLAVGANSYSSSIGRAYIFYSQNGQVNTNQNITGNATSDNFGRAMATGDFNADGRTDLAVGATLYSSNTGRAYIFYNDGSIPTTAGTADVTITGEAGNNYFGRALTSGDFNSDGRIDLVVGAYGYSTNTGRVYIFYNDGSIPTTAATADVIINATGTDFFGYAIGAGDFNSDGTTDLVIGGYGYPSGGGTGRAYIFYADGTNNFGTATCTGSSPTSCSATNADVTITGEGLSEFTLGGFSVGDFNSDGRIDLAVSAASYNSSMGRTYIFYNDGSIPTTAATADVIITGEATTNSFGRSTTAGDFNADGRTDLAVGANQYSSSTGRAYIFYNDGVSFGGVACTTGCLASNADVIITGQNTNDSFGYAMTSGDFNADGKIDLVVGAYSTSSNTGRAYIFYNDGSIPTTAANADLILIGETTSNYYGAALTAGDFNADGRADLVVGAYGYSTNTGRVYFYETRENFAWKLQQLSPDTGGLRTGLSGTGEELKITGNAASDQFGYAMTTGDFNSDGKTDLAVGAPGYNSNQGRVYLFYDDGTLSSGASGADVIITGEATSNHFGASLAAGDFNADGQIDFSVGAEMYNSSTGRAYIFYNDGSIPTTAATADIIITGELSSSYFGFSLTAGDFNSDGRIDLAVGSHGYSTDTGRAYIFYNDGSIPTTAASADIIITNGTTSNYFGLSLASADFNADGRIDLAIGAPGYSSGTGRTYIFYNDGSIPTTAATADVTITGETFSNYFGYALTTGDFNADGRTDLAVGATLYSSNTGRAYIFYNDGSIPTTAGTADVTITGEAGNNYFGRALTSGDFNSDGRIDLVVGAYGYSTNTGRVYIFYNDGSIPTTAATADVILTGETTSNYFGFSLAAGDLNGDGRTDLVAGAYGYSGSRGRAYIYTLNDPVITGEATSNNFGYAMTAGDFNADGKTDLAVGAQGYSTSTGRVYIFYNDGTIPSTAASADVIITGEATGNLFGQSLAAGDLNADGKIDLAVGAYGAYKVYIFYNDGSIPTTAATADVIISGSNIGDGRMAIGDLNSDGKPDLLATAASYSSNGRGYLFYADGTNNFGSATCTGSAPTACSASNADIIVDGTGSKRIAGALIGDVNADGRDDMLLAGTNGTAGALYVLYNDGVSFGTAACTTACSVTNADVSIAGENNGDSFGGSIGIGDMNNDGKLDIVTVASNYSSNTGRVYIFYNDGSYPSAAANADVIITGEGSATYEFGGDLKVADMNADGHADIIVGARSYGGSAQGFVYIVYNDGTYPSTFANADVKIPGEGTGSYFGVALAVGDFNSDGKTDLAVGAYAYSTSTGRVYLFTSEAAVTSAPSATGRVRGVGKLRGTATLR